MTKAINTTTHYDRDDNLVFTIWLETDEGDMPANFMHIKKRDAKKIIDYVFRVYKKETYPTHRIVIK